MRYPLVKQNGLKDCGPCSLASIIIYYKGYLSVEKLSFMMNTTKNGTTAYDLIETAKKIGFECYGVKKELEDLKDIILPCIVHVTLSKTYNHFIIVYKIDKKNKRILIGDPADKVKYLTFDEFCSIWNNVVIELTPLKQLPVIKPKSLIRYVSDILYINKINIIKIVIISNLLLIISVIYSLLIKYLIDNINNLKINYVLVLLLVFIIKTIILFINNLLTIKTSKNISNCLTNGIISSLILLPYPYYRNHTTGEVMSRFSDVESIKVTINEFLAIIIQIPLIIVFLIFLFYLNSDISILIYLIIILYIFISSILTYKLNKYVYLFQEKKALFNSLLTESINGFESIKGLSIENDIMNKNIDKYKAVEDIIYKYRKINNLKTILEESVINIGSIIILILSFLYYKNNWLSFGSIIIIYMIYNLVIDPITNLINFYIKYKEASNVSKNIQEFDYKLDDKKGIVSDYTIEYRHVNYNIGLKKILKNINIKIHRGEKVFISGPSGSGKSTLVKLLKGYYKINNLFIGNRHINDINLGNIIYIGQKETLFTGTVRDNIMCDDDEKIKDVVKMCLVSNKLDMLVEENGFNLSGGEKERIVLARALIKKFDILIIDEGLQEVDISMERIILKNIFNKYKDKTIIVISHRMDNLDLYDRMIELNNGEIVKDINKHFN